MTEPFGAYSLCSLSVIRDKEFGDIQVPFGEQVQANRGHASTFVDRIASIIDKSDRKDFFDFFSVEMLLCPVERNAAKNLIAHVSGAVQPFLLTLGLWSDSITRSFVFSVRAIPLPNSKYISISSNRQIKKCAFPCAHLAPKQRASEYKTASSNQALERVLLTEEQLIASEVPLDDALEFDAFDVDTVAEYFL